MKFNRFIALMMILLLCTGAVTAGIAENPVITDTMKVVNCEKWVSLRELPAQNSQRLKQVPLGALVYRCVKSEKGFAYCQYEGVFGYILYKYLEPLESTQTDASNDPEAQISMETMLNNGELVLDWKEYNIHVLASRSYLEKNKGEILNLGCYIDQEPIWNMKTELKHAGSEPMLDAYIGGKSMDPQVLLYNQAYGLSMIDLLTGKTMWTISAADTPIGAVACTVSSDEGILYLASADGQKVTAVSSEGDTLWTANIKDKSVDQPAEIRLSPDEIEVHYRNGKQAYLEFDGKVIGVYDEKPQGGALEGAPEGV